MGDREQEKSVENPDLVQKTVGSNRTIDWAVGAKPLGMSQEARVAKGHEFYPDGRIGLRDDLDCSCVLFIYSGLSI
ncbi:unnamed protein product [Brassica rapa]|uniref:Uncharacterized protein n=1 Tax=Brassica campestris TaxID=3711 RepID=A0A8D9G047_BRACM|nr:unnamed protein product [Brassica rapa]